MPNTARIRITRIVDPDLLPAQIAPKMSNLGQAMGARMQRIVPKRTYALNDTIEESTVVEGSRIVTTVGAGSDEVSYAMDVERGTSKAAAQPYMRPAFAQTTSADLRYKGKGITRHGVVTFSSRRARARKRRKS